MKAGEELAAKDHKERKKGRQGNFDGTPAEGVPAEGSNGIGEVLHRGRKRELKRTEEN